MDDTPKRRDPNPASEEYGRSRRIILKNQIPGGPFDLHSGPKRHRPQHALERRIAHPRGHHQRFFVRALAIEKLRTFPSESVSRGSSKVISRYWPALNVHPDGFSNRKAMVPFRNFLAML